MRPVEHGPLRFEPDPRVHGRRRLLTRLPEDLARPLASGVRALVPALERSLGAGVVTHRWMPVTESPEPWAAARGRLRRRLRAIGPPGRGATIVRSDVLACYASIGLQTVAACLPPDDRGSELLLRTLARIHARGGVGLPVGPPASAIVANAVLAPADRAIASSGARHVRWVDDVLIVAEGPRQALRALDAWRAALAAAGLEANPTKTWFDQGPDEVPRWVGSAWGSGRDVR